MSTSKMEDFNVLEELGSGSYGVVYKVSRKVDNKIYVMKKITLTGLSTEEQKDAAKEAHIMASVDSPYVVKYRDSFLDTNKLCIVMEYCDSGDLDHIIKKRGAIKSFLPEEDIWSYFMQITLGLYSLHSLHILHRDLKPANIFICNKTHLKIGDMGVAKVLGSSSCFASTMVGTPYYLSPELCKNEPYNNKSDIWALGCIIYECCTFTHPFLACNQAALILKIIRARISPISSYGCVYSTEISKLCDWLLLRDTSKRPDIITLLSDPYIRNKAESLNYEIPKDIPTAKKSTICPAMNKRLRRKVKSSSTTITKSKSQSKDLSAISSQASTTSNSTTNAVATTGTSSANPSVRSTPSTNSKYRKKRSVSSHNPDEVKNKGLVRGNRIRKKGGQRVLSKGNYLPPSSNVVAKPTTPTTTANSNGINNKPTTPTLPSVVPPRPLSSSKIHSYNSELVANLPDNVNDNSNNDNNDDYNFINTKKTTHHQHSNSSKSRSRSSSSHSNREYKDGNESKLSESKIDSNNNNNNNNNESTLPSESTMILHNTEDDENEEDNNTCKSLLNDELKKTNLTTITEEKSTPSDTMTSTEKSINSNTMIVNNNGENEEEVLNESKLDTVIINKNNEVLNESKLQDDLSIETNYNYNNVINNNDIVDDIIIDSVSKTKRKTSNNILDDSNPLTTSQSSSNSNDYRSIIDDSVSRFTSNNNNNSALPSGVDSDTFEYTSPTTNAISVSNEFKCNRDNISDTFKTQLKQVHSEVVVGGGNNNEIIDNDLDDDSNEDENDDDEEEDEFDDLDSRQEEKSFEYDDMDDDENIKQNNYRNIKEGIDITTTPKNLKGFNEEEKKDADSNNNYHHIPPSHNNNNIHKDKNGVEFSIECNNNNNNLKSNKCKSSYLHNRTSTPGLSDNEDDNEDEYESDESEDYKSHEFYNEDENNESNYFTAEQLQDEINRLKNKSITLMGPTRFKDLYFTLKYADEDTKTADILDNYGDVLEGFYDVCKILSLETDLDDLMK